MHAHLCLLLRQRGLSVEPHRLHLKPQRQALFEKQVLPLHPPQPGLQAQAGGGAVGSGCAIKSRRNTVSRGSARSGMDGAA